MEPSELEMYKEIVSYLEDEPESVKLGFKAKPMIQIVPRGARRTFGYNLPNEVFVGLMGTSDRIGYLKALILQGTPLVPDCGLGFRIVEVFDVPST